MIRCRNRLTGNVNKSAFLLERRVMLSGASGCANIPESPATETADPTVPAATVSPDQERDNMPATELAETQMPKDVSVDQQQIEELQERVVALEQRVEALNSAEPQNDASPAAQQQPRNSPSPVANPRSPVSVEAPEYRPLSNELAAATRQQDGRGDTSSLDSDDSSSELVAASEGDEVDVDNNSELVSDESMAIQAELAILHWKMAQLQQLAVQSMQPTPEVPDELSPAEPILDLADLDAEETADEDAELAMFEQPSPDDEAELLAESQVT